MNEKPARRTPSAVPDTSQSQVPSLAEEKKRKVTVITEEHGPDELQEELTSSSVVDTEENLLSEEQIKEFFTATEEGSIERLDELFDKTSNADPNITLYTESLLMAAIRAKQTKVAEYLIDQLAINVDHTAELLEFNARAKIPIRERIISSRDLAYDEGMMNLVDLIDIAARGRKASTKRFLQQRIKPCLDEIHQAYLKRLHERRTHVIIPAEEKEVEELPTVTITDTNDATTSIPPPIRTHPPPVLNRSCKSYIEETLQSIQSSNDKSIDETGRKYFRFSGYTVRYRIVDTITNTDKSIKDRSQSKKARMSFPLIPRTTSQLSPSSLSKSRTTTTTPPNLSSHSFTEINTQIPIRETRTSICRSALHRSAPRICSRLSVESDPEMNPSTKTLNNTPRRVPPKRIHQINTNYGYIPQVQPTVYNEPRRFIPVTLKSTAVGLPSDKPFIRD